ncbi:MAG TPA: hypothetical protein VFN78_10150 [Ktedonobacterales bacterium]|nr:hypothetical protein [Ktedonobacterales bacterium]
MSSGRPGGPSGRNTPEPALDAWGQRPAQTSGAPRVSGVRSGATSGARSGATSGVTSQPISDLPALPSESMPPMGRTSYDASVRGIFEMPPGGEVVSGAAAAELFGDTTRQPARPTGQRTTARIEAVDPLTASAPAVALTGPESATGRAPTLTQQIRSMQPPDVARQAINELTVLASELSTLAQQLEQSGLARIHADAYFDAVRRYGDLARRAWLSVAAERLEQDGASQDYRQLVVGVARDITRLRRESEVAASNEQFPLPRRRPYLWRSRSRAISHALSVWQRTLSAPADPLRMGRALFDLRGALNTARVAPVEYASLSLVTGAALWLTPLSGVAAGMVSVANAFSRQPLVAASYALVTLIAFMLWTILLLLTSRGRVTLVETLAGACFSETRSACNGHSGSRGVAIALRGWWLLIGGVGALLTLATFIGSGYALERSGLLAPLTRGLAGLSQAPVDQLRLVAGLLAAMTAPTALVATATLLALALPALIVNTLRLAVEMAGSRRWAPAARRYALTPALATLSYLTGGLVALAWLLADRLGLAQRALVSSALIDGAPHLIISERAPLLALALALPYLALIELPFRLGLGGWRRAWLRDLRARRTTIEAHVRRLSAPDPTTGAPDTSEETLRIMQYDLVLLQFYSTRIAEAERASAAALGLGGALAVLLIIVVGALLLDGGAHTLAQALTIRLTP